MQTLFEHFIISYHVMYDVYTDEVIGIHNSGHDVT